MNNNNGDGPDNLIRLPNNNIEQDNSPKKRKIKKKTKKLLKLIGEFAAFAVTIVLSAIAATWQIRGSIGDIQLQIASLQNDIDVMKNDIDVMKNDIIDLKKDNSEFKEFLFYDDGVKDQLGVINEALHIEIITVPNEEEYAPVKNSIPKATSGYGIQSSIKLDTKIGIYKNGNDCFVKDVIDERIILTYTEGNSEIYFYGTYNENCHWDGYCVTNVYSLDGILTGICESNFDDGKRLDYKSFYLSKSNNNEWIYVNKENLSESNIGTSIKYEFTYNKIKNFTSTNVKVSDIIFVDDFIEDNSLKMLSYYYGNTSDEEYNDILSKEDIKKGKKKAYLVLFDDNGYVNIFYISNFIDGYANDDNAVEIVLDQTPDNYDYFKYEGKIENNIRKGNSEKKYVTNEEILDIISGLTIDIDLKWHMEKEQGN